jgi:hypothetical protein
MVCRSCLERADLRPGLRRAAGGLPEKALPALYRLLACRRARSLDQFRATDCRMLGLGRPRMSLFLGKKSREGFLLTAAAPLPGSVNAS